MHLCTMATPIKSPLQKKHKGDEGPDDDIEITSVNPGGNQQPVSLEAIEKLLDRKLDPLNCFLQQIHLDLGAFKESVRVEFEGMGLRLTETESQVAATMKRVEALEQEIGKLKMVETTPRHLESSNTRPLSMMVGNIPGASSLEDAKSWLDKHCRSVGIVSPGPSDVYKKGSDSNLVFVKCQSESHRERFIQSIRDESRKLRDSSPTQAITSQLFAKVDLPFDVRTVEGALYAMKKMLVSWSFNASCIKYDIHSGVLSVAGREIVKVSVQNFAMKFMWCDGEWQAWEELHKSTEMADISNQAHMRLEKAKARASNKGKGKGPE